VQVKEEEGLLDLVILEMYILKDLAQLVVEKVTFLL